MKRTILFLAVLAVIPVRAGAAERGSCVEGTRRDYRQLALGIREENIAARALLRESAAFRDADVDARTAMLDTVDAKYHALLLSIAKDFKAQSGRRCSSEDSTVLVPPGFSVPNKNGHS